MKHFTSVFNSLVAVMMLLLSGGLTACGGDDDDEPQTPDTWSTAYSVKVNFTEDYLKVADITAHVAYPDGTFQEIPVTNADFSLTLKGTKTPDKAGVAITFIPKQDIAEGVYSLGTDASITGYSIKNGEVFSSQMAVVNNKQSVSSDKIANLLTNKGIVLAMSVDAEGTVSRIGSDDIDFGLNGVWEWIAGVLVKKD